MLRHRWLRVSLVWLLGPWLARPILRRGHAACLKRLRLLEWQVIEKPRMERERHEVFLRYRQTVSEANDRLAQITNSHVEWLGPNGRFL